MNDINKKISQFIEVEKTDNTTQIPIVQGSPLFNAKITPEKLAKDIAKEVKREAELDKVDNTSDLEKPVSDAQDVINKSLDTDIQTRATKESVNKKVDKVEGKTLSSNDYTNLDKREVEKVKDKSDKTYVDSELNKKVDKVDGKRLTTNDYTTDEKNKLRDIEVGANKYVHPDSHSALMIEQTTTRRFVSDIEKAKWNDKESKGGSQAKANKALSDAKSYVDGKVKTNVPENAKFTDTVVDISGKVDKEIGKSLIANSEIDRLKNVTNQDVPSKVSELENDSKFLVVEDLTDLGGGDMLKAVYDTDDDGIVDNAKKVNGFTVESNVPADAKFTDTTYTSGDNISIVDGKISITGQLGLTEEQVKKVKVDSATDADTVGGFSVGVYVPADAKFTDTVFDLSPYLKKRNDTLNSYVEKLVTIDETNLIDLNDGNVFLKTISADVAFAINNAKEGAHSFTLFIEMNTVAELIFPTEVKWEGGEMPDMTEADKTYILTFLTINQGTTWFGIEGGAF